MPFRSGLSRYFCVSRPFSLTRKPRVSITFMAFLTLMPGSTFDHLLGQDVEVGATHLGSLIADHFGDDASVPVIQIEEAAHLICPDVGAQGVMIFSSSASPR